MARNQFVFTLREMHGRLRAAKSFLAANDRVRYVRSDSSICVPNYDPESIDAFLCKSGVDTDILSSFVLDLPRICSSVEDSVVCSEPDPISFTENPRQPRKIGLVVPMLFYERPASVIRLYAALWLGTWHHAPVIAWGNAALLKKGSATIMCQKLPAYSDLL